MILVADAGGTKTDWRLLNGNQISQFATRGYNPNTHQLKDFLDDISPTFLDIQSAVSKLFFYGASLYPESTDFKNGISSLYPKAQIEINNDLLGSCRSLSSDQPAFVGILGTGSAGCYYDGNDITNHVPSLGYSLGDEGGGAYLGRKLLNLALRNRLDDHLQLAFDQEFNLTKEEVYVHIYKKDGANAYLASFAHFLFAHKSDPQISELIATGLKDYLESYFITMDGIHKYPFHFSGSIAYYFGDFIREIGAKLKMNIGRIIQSPISGLALYHQAHG
ncbi:MAG: hypothetical protein GY816_21975 [Cytophagales bacterium]|nr:hypothetical protein [Cytophagales bacterium]